MKETVVLTAAFPAVARDLLAGQFEVVEHPTEASRTEEEMITMLAEADGAVTLLSDPITRRVMTANPNLRIVANFAAGYDNIDVDAARELGVAVTNTPDVLTDATADLTMALLLAVTRRIVEGDLEVRRTGRCRWDPLALLGTSLQGKTLGIIGCGRIGSAVGRRAAAFGMQVIEHSKTHGVAMDDLLRASDVVSLHAPLGPGTHHLIGRAALTLMKEGAYLVNTSRGALVDEAALCDALESGRLGGAALDVYEYEPAVTPRLLPLRNVVIVPHIGSATEEARQAMARSAAGDVRRFLSGLEPIHRVV